ncbi:hypothetical protein KEC35_01865 [Candidatus Schneideria nysicola]|nr:hypothetical protein KEC35_01865 [Candidatus Schneideria nysicola]UAJ65813.1 hypothetical protein KEC37_01865 [Candidatus Schneideria nysicola]UAJ66345.1 hypothetical protein KEC38_01865 [Candidatus Schneideria nysicola]
MARHLAFEYLRRINEELSPADYLQKFEQLELEFISLIQKSSINSEKTTTGICDFLSRFCPKCKGDGCR